jgi:hypothetical protein
MMNEKDLISSFSSYYIIVWVGLMNEKDLVFSSFSFSSYYISVWF